MPYIQFFCLYDLVDALLCRIGLALVASNSLLNMLLINDSNQSNSTESDQNMHSIVLKTPIEEDDNHEEDNKKTISESLYGDENSNDSVLLEPNSEK